MHEIPSAHPFVVGVLGGMGSYSTLHFFEQLLDAFPVEKEWERPRVVIDNNCVLPSRVVALLRGEGREELVRGMAESISLLLDGYEPDVIVMPCHTAHCFLPAMRERLCRQDRVLDMIDLVACQCSEQGLREVFLLATEGTIATRVYDGYCARYGVHVSYPDEETQERTRAFIEQVKQRAPRDPEAFVQFLEGLNAPAVILGCTELSVLYAERQREPAAALRVVDPIERLVGRLRTLADAATATG